MQARSQLLHDAEKMMMDDMPVAPVYYYTNNFLLKSYVDGVCFSPAWQPVLLELHYYKEITTERVSISEEASQRGALLLFLSSYCRF